MSFLNLVARAAFAVVLIGGAVWVPPAWPADEEIVIRANAIEPHVYRATMGQRVNFVKRVDLPVHVEFGVDPGQHHVVQIQGNGSIWAQFQRPGTHPYVVHIYATKMTTILHGIVEVVEDPQHPWAPGTCAAVVMGVCIEP
jgi:plastocyanin